MYVCVWDAWSIVWSPVEYNSLIGMDSEDYYMPNHNEDEGPGFDPIYYEGEEYEQNQLDFIKEPVETAIDGYFDYQTPIIIKKEAERKQNKDTAVESYKNLVAYSKIAAPKKNKANAASLGKNQLTKRQVSAGPSDIAGGWSNDTKTTGVFDNKKKNEIFGFHRGQPESQSKPLAQKIEKSIQAQQPDQNQPPVSYADIMEIEKHLSKENANTIKSIIKTNEAKLKLLEDQLKKEEKNNKNQSKEFMDKMKAVVGDQQKSEEYIKAMKAKNDQILKAQGFKPAPTTAPVLKNQKKSDIHPVAAPKTKTANYGGAGDRKKSKGKIADQRIKPVVEFREMPSPNYTLHDNARNYDADENRGTGVTWGDQLQMLKEGYAEQLKKPSIYNGDRGSSQPRDTYASLYQMAAPGTYMNDTFQTHDPMRATERQTGQNTLNRTMPRPTKPSMRDQFEQNMINLQEFRPTNLTNQGKHQHGSDLIRLEDQLSNIRNELKPLINQVNRWPKTQGPTAELMSASIGRLIKIHSEKMANMLIDDMLIEIIAVLNAKEESEKRIAREVDVKTMALALCDELNQIDVDQRLIFEGANSKAVRTVSFQDYNTAQAGVGQYQRQPILDSNFALDLLHQPASEGRPYMTSNNEGHYNRDFDSKDLRKLASTSMFVGKGPYKGDFSHQSKVAMPHDMLVKLLRDQIMNEDAVQRVPYLRRQNVAAMEIDSDRLIDEALEQVLREFEEAQDEYVQNVVKGEFE